MLGDSIEVFHFLTSTLSPPLDASLDAAASPDAPAPTTTTLVAEGSSAGIVDLCIVSIQFMRISNETLRPSYAILKKCSPVIKYKPLKNRCKMLCWHQRRRGPKIVDSFFLIFGVLYLETYSPIKSICIKI